MFFAACGDKATKPPVAVPDAAPATPAAPARPAELAEILALEGKRDLGGGRLAALARHADPRVRAAAVGALGRIGGADAVAALTPLVADADRDLAVAAAAALGIAAGGAGEEDLHRLLWRVADDPARLAVVLDAVGRAGSAGSAPELVKAGLKSADAGARAAAALALGHLGRRKLAIGEPARDALVAAVGDGDAAVRYGVVYALLREQPVVRDPEVEAALVARAGDEDPEIRALALRALATRAPGQHAEIWSRGLEDDDWRVRVQAAKALAGEKSTPAMHATLAAWALREWTALADLRDRIASSRVHPVLVALDVLGPFAAEPPVRSALAKLHAATDVSESTVKERYTPDVLRAIDAVNCLTAAAQVRAGARLAVVLGCGEAGGTGWPMHKRKELAVTLIAAGLGGSLDARIAALGELAKDRDFRVRAAAAGAAVAIDDPRALRIARDGLADAEPIVAASVADGVAARARSERPVHAALVEGILALAAKPDRDPEVRLSFLDALAAVKAPAAEAAFKEALADPNVTLREKGREGLTALTGRDPGPPPGKGWELAAPAEPSALFGMKVTWKVTTTRGAFVIELDPELAPWAVAALTALAQKGFYQGVRFHRVEPDFVVQGGDPGGSGWGGPGFVLPAEPSTRRYRRGSVGIADAGRDTGGCQFFVMHSAAPHLEQRYTMIGQVVEGMEVVDALMVGDAIDGVEVVVAERQ